MSGRLADTLIGLGPGQVLRFPLAVWPLADVLLTAHVARFTGRLVIRAPGDRDLRGPPAPGADQLYLREGSLVGLERVGPRGARGLCEVLIEQCELDPAEAEAFVGVATSGLDLCRRLEERGLVSRRSLDRAVAEHGRRRLFARASEEASALEARAGLDALASFHPVYIDPRPAIAFGLVVHGRLADKKAIVNRFARRRARLVVPYDVRRNAYGLPPPIASAVRQLSEGVEFGPQPSFPGLSWSDTAGVLLLMDRIDLLELVEPVPRKAVSNS